MQVWQMVSSSTLSDINLAEPIAICHYYGHNFFCVNFNFSIKNLSATQYAHQYLSEVYTHCTSFSLIAQICLNRGSKSGKDQSIAAIFCGGVELATAYVCYLILFSTCEHHSHTKNNWQTYLEEQQLQVGLLRNQSI